MYYFLLLTKNYVQFSVWYLPTAVLYSSGSLRMVIMYMSLMNNMFFTVPRAVWQVIGTKVSQSREGHIKYVRTVLWTSERLARTSSMASCEFFVQSEVLSNMKVWALSSCFTVRGRCRYIVAISYLERLNSWFECDSCWWLSTYTVCNVFPGMWIWGKCN